MKRYPLQTLVRLREHRVEAARQQVLDRQREARECQDALDFEQKQQRARLLDPPPPGVPWPNAMAQREAHIGLLGEQADESQAVDAAAQVIGCTPAPLALLPLEDAMASEEQPNLPGPGNEHPNWRRRWSACCCGSGPPAGSSASSCATTSYWPPYHCRLVRIPTASR